MRTRTIKTRVTGTVDLEALAEIVRAKEGTPPNAKVEFHYQAYEGGRNLVEADELSYVVEWEVREDV